MALDMNLMTRRYQGRHDSDVPVTSCNIFYQEAASKMLVGTNEIENDDILDYKMTSRNDEEIKTNCVPYLQSVMFATIMEDCITQMRILDDCNNEMRITKTMADINIFRAKKYQIKPSEIDVDQMWNVTPSNLGSMNYKLDKLAADRIYCGGVLIGTYLELALCRCYNCIVDSINAIEERDVYRNNLTVEEARNKFTRRELMKQLRQQRNHIKTVAYDTDLIVDQLKSQVEDATLNTEIRSRYTENWERARTEQHLQSIHDLEIDSLKSIEYYRNRTEFEQRVHSEVELLVNIFINEILMKVDTWMTKYEVDMEQVDLKIQLMKLKYEDTVTRRNDLENMIIDHDKLMKDWIQFKEDREKARIYTEKMTNSAIIVQAWWRGLLVRLEIGPYKPQKKAPPPKPGKKKK